MRRLLLTALLSLATGCTRPAEPLPGRQAQPGPAAAAQQPPAPPVAQPARPTERPVSESPAFRQGYAEEKARQEGRKPVEVRGYYRRDGTYVAPHTRRR